MTNEVSDVDILKLINYTICVNFEQIYGTEAEPSFEKNFH